MQQHLIVGLGAFGGAVIDRVRALPLRANVVYHALECPPERPVAAHYLEYRQPIGFDGALEFVNRLARPCEADQVRTHAGRKGDIHLAGRRDVDAVD